MHLPATCTKLARAWCSVLRLVSCLPYVHQQHAHEWGRRHKQAVNGLAMVGPEGGDMWTCGDDGLVVRWRRSAAEVTPADPVCECSRCDTS